MLINGIDIDREDEPTPSPARAESTRWTCAKCGASNVITYPHGESVYAVVEMIRASHASDNRSCETDLSLIRVAPEAA